MIHKQSMHHKEKPIQREINYWNVFNKQLFSKKRITYFLDKHSCSWYAFKYLWRKYLNRYHVPFNI